VISSSSWSRSTPTRSSRRPAGTARIDSIDVVRGIIIVIMALDHVRDFFGDFAASPTDLSTTTAALFFTRWITHLCAPTFFLLTGSGAYLRLAHGSRASLSRFLVTRGLWLLILELVVMRFALQFNLDYHVTIITVLWALGWSMIVLAALVWLPLWAIASFGALLVVGHNAFDSAGMAREATPLMMLLHQPGIVYRSSHSVVAVSYVLIPWIGVTALGYVLGAAYSAEPAFRQRLLLHLGSALVAGFVLLRLINLYGDPAPWSTQRSPLWTLMSFLNTTKYPPSLLFLTMTLGPALLLLRLFDPGVPAPVGPLLVFGKVPLFFYVLHFFLIHLLTVLLSWLRYGEVAETFESPDLAHFPFSAPAGWNVGLPAIYAIWLLVVVALFPLCRWYAGLKRRRHDWWLSYV
jgi:uncharacterized membrane protein